MFNLVNAPFQGNLGYPKFTISLVYYSARSPQIINFIMPGLEIAAAIGTSLINAFSSKHAIDARNEAQRRESELSYQRQRMAIKEQNSYNSASAQMARLAAAGLNPNLMYENGQQAVAGTQDDIASYEPAEIQSFAEPFSQAGSQVINSMIGLKDMENKTSLAESQVLLNSSLVGVNASQIALNDVTADNIIEQLGLRKREVDQMIKESESRIQINESNKAVLAEQAKELAQRVKESEERVRNIIADTKYTETLDIVAAALLPSQIELNQMNAYQAFNLGRKAYEDARLVCAYYYFDLDKFEFEQRKFEDTLKFQEDQNKRDRWLGYSNLGVQFLSLAASVATKGAGSLSSLASSPWQAISNKFGSGRAATFNGPSNGFQGSNQAQWNYKNRKR